MNLRSRTTNPSRGKQEAKNTVTPNKVIKKSERSKNVSSKIKGGLIVEKLKKPTVQVSNEEQMKDLKTTTKPTIVKITKSTATIKEKSLAPVIEKKDKTFVDPKMFYKPLTISSPVYKPVSTSSLTKKDEEGIYNFKTPTQYIKNKKKTRVPKKAVLKPIQNKLETTAVENKRFFTSRLNSTVEHKSVLTSVTKGKFNMVFNPSNSSKKRALKKTAKVKSKLPYNKLKVQTELVQEKEVTTGPEEPNVIEIENVVIKSPEQIVEAEEPVDNDVSNPTSMEVDKTPTNFKKPLGPNTFYKQSQINQAQASKDKKEEKYHTGWMRPLAASTPYDYKVRRKFKPVDEKQMIIDAGQKEIGAVKCDRCDMIYTPGQAQDEQTHNKHHSYFTLTLKFPGWKKVNVIGEFPDGKIILVNSTDPKFMKKKVEEVRQLIDRDLGFPTHLNLNVNLKYLLFISHTKQIAGFLAAETITQAYPILPNEKEASALNFPKGGFCCSTVPVKALCGINRIWTSSKFRRQSIASRLVSCLRSNFIYGYYIDEKELAFSDPTPDGHAFASKLFNQYNVYK